MAQQKWVCVRNYEKIEWPVYSMNELPLILRVLKCTNALFRKTRTTE